MTSLKCKKESNSAMLSFPEPISLDQLYHKRFDKFMIVLEPTPSENVDFSLNFRRPHHRASNSPYFFCEYKLTFQNNLHEMCNDYGYNLSVQFLVLYKNKLKEHLLVFLKEECRTGKEINSFKKIRSLPSFESIVHICCNIQRFKKKGEQILNKHSQNNVSTILFETGIYSDVSFVIDDNFIINAHKHILSSKSEVFSAMFCHTMFKNENGLIHIVDFDFEIVQSMLEYIYTGKTNINEKNSYELFKIANKYKINNLLSECEEYFLFNLDLENIVKILYLAYFCEAPELNRYATSFIKNNEAEIIKDTSYQEFLCKNLNLTTFFPTLELYAKYNLQDMKSKLLEFIKVHNNDLVNKPEFLLLFHTHPDVMKEAYIHISK